MIIKEVKLKKSFFFDDEVVILTDTVKISFIAEWDRSLVDKINNSLKNFKLESVNDFEKLNNALKFLDQNKYLIFEKNLINGIKSSWRFFDPAARQVPRPINVVYRKNLGIKEFVVFSLNTKSFGVAIETNRRVTDYLTKKIKDVEHLREEEILMLIKEAIDKEHSLVDFELRIGVVFDNHKDGKYFYREKEFNEDEQYKFVSKLIDKYNVVYVENPFSESNLELYKKLSEAYRKKCLICMNSKINEYSSGINKKAFNTVVAKFTNVSSFKADVDFYKDHRINVVVDADFSIMDVAVCLGVPLVKLYDYKKSFDTVKKLNNISEEIVRSRVVSETSLKI